MFEGDDGLRIGTSSWSERDWVGCFYPLKTPPAKYIQHYSGVFDTVECDATFYRMPTEKMISGWCERTPENFRFAAKVPRLITHEKVLDNAKDDLLLFVEIMQGLGDRLGPLLFQFPYFNRKAFSGPEPFFERLDHFLEDLPTGPRYVVELRNKAWVVPAAQEICSRHGVALAWVEQAWMPSAREWSKRLGGPSADFAYIRFLGDHKAIEQITDRWDQVVIDQRQVVARWVPVIRALREQGVEVFGFFNNHFAGHAPATIELFRELWCSELGKDPQTPRETPTTRPSQDDPHDDGPEELSLPF